MYIDGNVNINNVAPHTESPACSDKDGFLGELEKNLNNTAGFSLKDMKPGESIVYGKTSEGTFFANTNNLDNLIV